MNTTIPTSSETDDFCSNVISFTIVSNNAGPLTKGFQDDGHGGFIKRPEPPLFDGEVRRVRLPASEEWARAFTNHLLSLRPNEAVICGDYDGPDTMALVSKQRHPTRPDAHIRTKDTFQTRVRTPGLVFIDIDAKDLPRRLREDIANRGGLLATLDQAAPGLAAAGYIARPSVSSGVINERSGREYPGGGLHLYFAAFDGGDTRDFVQRVSKRAVLLGYGYASVSKAGVISIRSPIDAAASGDPCRLCYEADPVFGPGIAQKPSARMPQAHPGPLLDTRGICPPLTVEEEANYKAKCAELIANVREEAEAVRAEWSIRQGEKRRLTNRAISADPVKFGGYGEPIKLYGEAQILLDDGVIVTVLDILREPKRFQGMTCADPLEWDYGGGRNKAIIKTACPSPEIFSHAHGGQTFLLRLNAADLVTLLSDKEARHG